MAARTFGRRGEGEGSAGMGNQVIATSPQKRDRQLRGESERPKRTRRSIGRSPIDLVEDIGTRALGKCDIELSMLSHGQGGEAPEAGHCRKASGSDRLDTVRITVELAGR